MKRALGLAIPTAVGIAAGVLLGQAIFGNGATGLVEAGDPTFGLGDDFSALSVTDLDGSQSTIGELARGGLLVLTIRDAFCPVSRRYGPKTGRFSREYAQRGVRFAHLNISPLDSREDMEGEIAAYGLEGPYVADHDWDVARALRVIATGEVFVFDGSGLLRYRGAIDDQYGIRFTKPEPRDTFLVDAVEQLLAGQEVALSSTPPEGCYLAADVHEIDYQHERSE